MYNQPFHKLMAMIGILILLTAIPTLCYSQETRGTGYLFAAPGATVETGGGSAGMFHFGGGADARIIKGLHFEGELGYLTPYQDFSKGIGVLSADALYKFSRGEKRLIPFVAGGYSLGFRSGSVNMVNFGGGVEYWISRRHGLRFEFRDHFAPNYTEQHMMGFRVAWTFR